MEWKKFARGGAFGLLLIAIGGCYEYKAPPAATLGETYTRRDRDKADELLNGITELTLADAQRIAMLNNPTYIAASHAVNAARMRYYQAWGAYSPVVSANFTLQENDSWSRRQENSSGPTRTRRFSTSTGVSATWLVFDGLAREFNIKAASHSLDYQRLLEEDECRTLMRAVAYAYNDVLLAIENKRISLEDRNFQQISLKDTQMKFQAGAVPLSDVLNFEIQMNAADGDLIAADYQYETAIYSLAVLMGYPEGTLPPEIKFPSDFKTNFSDLPSVDIYLDTALANRPDLKGYREQLEVARYQMYQTYSAYSPTVNAFLDLSYGTNLSRYSGGQSPYSHSYSESPAIGYGLTADWTIFNGFIRYNKMREYQAAVAVADFQVAQKWLDVVGEVRAAYANYIQSVRQTRIYEKTRDLSAKQRDLVDEGYRAGNVELTRLNEAQRDLVEAETNLASSYVAIQNAKAQLDAAVYANQADYYKDPVNTRPGKLENTPAPGLSEKEMTEKSEQTQPASAPNTSIIPGTADATAPTAPVAEPKTPAVKAPAVNEKSTEKTGLPALKTKTDVAPIPATPTAPPASQKTTAPAAGVPEVLQP